MGLHERYRKIIAGPPSDLWKVGVVHASRDQLLREGLHAALPITWLPDPGSFRFLADPFCMMHDGKFSVLVEAYDYRTKHGTIAYYTYDAAWNLVAQGDALVQPFHLSYPMLLRERGEIYMLPEAHKSGRLTLYRAVRFPDRWMQEEVLLEVPAIDASTVFYENRWWMFYSLPGPGGRAMRELHVAYADQLRGPWHQHAANPVRTGLDASRPGGTPWVQDGTLFLPMQDCTQGYGDAVNILRVEQLTPQHFSARTAQRFEPASLETNYRDGLHTFAGDAEVTLIDVKHICYSHRRRWVNAVRRVRRS